MNVANQKMIAVVDDNATVRQALTILLGRVGYSVTCFSDPEVFLAGAHLLPAACILLDVQMPKLSGIDVLRRLRERGVAIPIIVMTGQGRIETAVLAMKLGATDFLEKPFAEDILLAAVETTLPSSLPLPSDVSEATRKLNSLSKREFAVLDAIMKGNSNKKIAFLLGISPRTVEGYRARTMKKLGVRHIAEAVRLALMADRTVPASPVSRREQRVA